MTLFFTILFALLAINVILLVFSVNGAKDSISKTLRSTENSITKLLPQDLSDTEYKKAG